MPHPTAARDGVATTVLLLAGTVVGVVGLSTDAPRWLIPVVAALTLCLVVLWRLRSRAASESAAAQRATALLVELEVASARLAASEQEARRVAEETAERLERYDLALDAGGMAIWDWDLSAGVVRRSAQADALLGLPAGSHRGVAPALLPLAHPADRERMRSAIVAAVVDRRPFDHTYRVVRADGEVRHVRDIGHLVQDDDGRVRMHGVMLDITDRLAVEEALAARERTSRAVLDSLPSETVVLDADGTMVAVNTAWANGHCDETGAVWGVGDDYLAGWRRRDGLLPEVRDAIADGVEDVIARRIPELLHVYEVRATGTWYELRALPLHDSTGGVVVTHFDVTERKRVEAQLLQAQKMEAVGQLAGGVAHDFNNLLTAMGGYAELTRERIRSGDREGAAANLDQLELAAGRASRLVSQLLAFSRRRPARTAPVDLRATVAGLEHLLGRLIGSHIRIVTTLEAVPSVEADPGQLEQVIINLAVNARDAMPGGGRLDLATRVVEVPRRQADEMGLHPGPHVELRVSDTGTGMAPEVLANVFEPFFTTKGPGMGTGLGLPMVYGCVTQAGGHVRIDSTAGRGTVVVVLLPCTARVASPPPPEGSAAAPAVARGETILLVEDQPQVRHLLATALVRLGYTVLEAEDGRGGLGVAAAAEQPVDLLLTDVVMPELNGPELAERLRARDPGLRVLFMSGYTRDIAVPVGGEAGAAFLQKPFSLPELAAAVREALARHGVGAAAAPSGRGAPAPTRASS